MCTETETLISIVVPVYKVEAYLARCVDSILAQTYPRLQVILVDDGSPDRCGVLCDEYAARDGRVQVIHQPNGGVSNARNTGIRAAAGDFLGFVDSDDYIDPDMYETLLRKALDTDSDIVECNFHHTFSDGEDTEVVERYFDGPSLLCLGRGIVWNKLYRRGLLQTADAWFPDGLVYGEDMEFAFKLIPHVRRYEYIDLAPYHYVQRAESVNNATSRQAAQAFEILRNLREYYRRGGFYAPYRDAMEFLHCRYLLCSVFQRMCGIGDRAERREVLAENWRVLNEAFPHWRKNPILKDQRSGKALYMRSVGPVTYRIYSALLPGVFRLQRRLRSNWA